MDKYFFSNFYKILPIYDFFFFLGSRIRYLHLVLVAKLKTLLKRLQDSSPFHLFLLKIIYLGILKNC